MPAFMDDDDDEDDFKPAMKMPDLPALPSSSKKK
jgi:hypothetical protein